jgi:putative heme-binding domain-containing protein
MKRLAIAAITGYVLLLAAPVPADPAAPGLPTLEQELLDEDPADLAKAARDQGDPTRGAIVFYQQHLTCTKCHAFDDDRQLLGPDLTKPEKKPTDEFLVQSVLRPSKEIRKGYETVVVITDEGKSFTGLLVDDNDKQLVLRDPNQDGKSLVFPKDEIDEYEHSPQSVMPAALVNQLANRQQFLDLVRYVMEIAEKGPERAQELEPASSLYVLAVPEYEKRIDHAGMIADLNQESFGRGAAIYDRLCINCHGTKDRPGSLPTSLRFASDKFRNGSDPHSMYKTLTYGFGMMTPQTWMVPQQKYDVIHYVRETYLKPHNPTQYVEPDRAYLATLPKGDTRGPAPSKYEPWVAMDYGPNLIASYEIGKNASNFAYKGIAIRLDTGPGGVTRGRHWMLYDEDTFRVAGAWSGEGFIDYNAIMLNGKHAIHPRIVGQLQFENKTGPGWGHPETGRFDDPRFRGRDDRPYGPLPRDWAKYQGMYHYGHRVILSYTVGDTAVLEMPSADASSDPPIFLRTMNIGPRRRDMILQVAQETGTQAGLHPIADNELADRITVFGAGGVPVAETPAAEPGQAESGLTFDGGTSVQIGSADAFDMTHKDYTVYARIKTRADGSVFSKTAPSDTWVRDGKTLFIRGGRLCFDIGWVGDVSAKPPVNDGRWHDVAMTWEHGSGTARLYVDGQLAGSGKLQPKGNAPGHVVRLGFTAGNFPRPQTFFKGQMSDVRFYQRLLDDDDVDALTEADRADDGLVARWEDRVVGGSTVRDASGNGHDGEVVKGRPRPTTAAPREGVVVTGISRPIAGAQWLASTDGSLRLKIPAGDRPLKFNLSVARAENADEIPPLVERMGKDESGMDLKAFTAGGPPRWPGTLATKAIVGNDDGPLAIDRLTHPATNPWFCRVRLTGFDFMPDNKRVAVCSWDGDVWMVDGIDRPDEALTWQRIASGLFQPLGLKVIDGKIYVTCRDQIAVLHDFNDDGETDYYECFNNDHQVTEHFHEFAMGLQADREGNFYYAKSARHAKPALVPHHGTLLRVSKDGSRTEILAKGFRAANGVCINPDGSFFVTDQEGHWMPKNRINWVPRKGGFYGNMYGYHDVTDSSDEAMLPPLCWITNAYDRSPAELLWVTSDQWGPLKGSLLNTSYGYGMVYIVPHEKVNGQLQGGVSRLPIPEFPTGVMRGRFHPVDGQLYLCGMFAWAGSRNQPGGFYRLRYTGNPIHVPTGLRATREGLEITFSGTLDREVAANPANYNIKIWGLKRSAGYGSAHINERPLAVKAAELSSDAKTVTLQVPDLQPTWGMEIRYRLRGSDGEKVEASIHGTIHALGN